MLNPLKKCIISLQKSVKIMEKVMKICKKRQPKKGFPGLDGVKSSFGSMEISRQLELVFKFIDANGDGKISPVELREFLLCLGHEKSKAAEEASKMLRFLDSNGDGFVDLHEYMDAVMMQGDHHNHDHVHDVNDHDHVHDVNDHVYDDDNYGYDGYVDDGHYDGRFEEDDDDLMEAFLVFDTDKNGLISARELHQVLKRLGFADCSLKECNLMIKGVDKNGDGFVNFEEFKLMMMGCYGRS